MFFHNFKNSLKVLLKNKSLIFWTFIFPLLLGTLFKMAFSNIEKSEKLEIIEIGIINDNNYRDVVILPYILYPCNFEQNSKHQKERNQNQLTFHNFEI